MKSALKSLFMVLSLALVLVGATSAAFTAQASITGNTFSTGTAALQLWSPSTSWTNSFVNSTNVFSNIYPGWDKQYGVIVRNSGTVDLVTSVKGVHVSDNGDLRNQIKVALYPWDDANSNAVLEAGETDLAHPLGGWLTLEQWRNTGMTLGEIEAGVGDKRVVLRFTAPSDLATSYQGKTAVFDFVFTGTTDGAVQE